MRTKKFVDCATSLLVGLAVNFAVAAGDQHSVNLENEPPKSKYSPGLAAKIVNLKIESDENGIKIDAEGTDGDGNPTHAQYDAKFDGKDYAVTAKAVLDQQRADYTQTEVAHVKLAHRPGEIGSRRTAAGRRWNQHQLQLLRDRGGDQCFDFDLRRTLPM
jgi:hypothetical protein